MSIKGSNYVIRKQFQQLLLTNWIQLVDIMLWSLWGWKGTWAFLHHRSSVLLNDSLYCTVARCCTTPTTPTITTSCKRVPLSKETQWSCRPWPRQSDTTFAAGRFGLSTLKWPAARQSEARHIYCTLLYSLLFLWLSVVGTTEFFVIYI